MKQSLGLRTGLSLTMTPALQQAIRLLQLSSLDLQLELRQALESNVMLELAGESGEEEEEAAAGDEEAVAEAGAAAEAAEGEGATPDSSLDLTRSAEIPEEMPVDADWGDIYDSAAPASSGSGGDDDGLHDYLQANMHGTASLRDHLMWQASIAPFDEADAEMAMHLIDAVNDDGYLEDWEGLRTRLSETLKVPPQRVEQVLRAVQDFDPPGVAARDLAECLRLQLQQYPEPTPGRAEALRVLEAPMALLARREETALVRASGLSAEQVRAALALIQSLQPHPGRPYQAHESEYVAPDVFVTKNNGRWRVALNPEHTPRLRINSYYQGMIRRADTSRDQVTLKQHLQEARYFINSLEARNETLLKVAQCIVEEQRAFLDYGEEAMRPLVLRDIAERLGIHESTVSRATANKYMLTPRGLYELKFFFSSHVQTIEGGTCSATAIQAMIKRLIAQEEPAKPLSDSTLAEMLLKEGIQVARRTVAKYREALRIPPSHERKPPA
ncbi:MAG TPA: RNA polymerase factor sigma-54 [Nevskia sp.]|nr:RNA polymerase factor sigma-54 [Nevskia sp.]